MRDEEKAREQLISELAEMRRRIAALEASRIEHRPAEERLRTADELLDLLWESERRYRSFIENFHGIAFQCHLDFTPVFFQGAVEAITGYAEEDFLAGNPRWDQIIHPDDLHEFCEGMEKIRSSPGHSTEREYRILRNDGQIRWIHEIIQNIRDGSGKPKLLQGVLYDVTERKLVEEERTRLEAQLRQAQKMEAIGTLASGIAHDFNNLLTTITGFAQLSLMGAGGETRWREYIARIPEKVNQASKLISQLLTFSRRAVTEKKSLQLIPLVKETAKMLGRTLPEDIAVQLKTPGEIALVNADPTQMQQVIMNLCVNAYQAMPDGGELALSLENVTLDEVYCRQYPYARPGDHVCLSVRDTGVGMMPEVQARIFEPFFTTKKVGEGTGLGLSMVYGIVKTHEGHINVTSEVGKGSEFKVYLPAMRVKVVRRGFSAEERPAGGTETLLLVEDDAEVLATGRAMLEGLGYTVLTAANGVEAIEVYRAHRDGVAAVLTDMMMPKMGGLALYRALVEINPAVKALMMSGYSLETIADDPRARGLKGFVEKPLDTHKLGQAVRRALDE